MRILIVEDDTVIALCVGEALQEAGHEVIGPVARMEECLELAERELLDLALVDVGLLRNCKGKDMARVLLQQWKVMPIFVNAQHLEAQRELDAVKGYLNKSPAMKKLVKIIEIAKLVQHNRRSHNVTGEIKQFSEDAGRYLH